MNTVAMGEVVWPFRPDLLIRIDFLAWWHACRPALWADAPDVLTGAAVEKQAGFFAEAQRHPYFVQFARKKRYRKRPLGPEEARRLYAEGVATFLNLVSSIERRGYDPNTPIGLRSCWLQRSTGFGNQPRRRWFIGDGCHRFACLAWLERGRPLPARYFAIERKLVHRPLDWRATFAQLGVLGSEEQDGFDRLFAATPTPPWEALLAWSAAVRERFRKLDPE